MRQLTRHRKATPAGVLHTLTVLLAPYRAGVAAALGVIVASLAASLAGPALVAYAINDGLVGHRSLRVVDVAGAAYLLVTVAYFVFTRLQTRLVSTIGENVLNVLRKRVFAHLLAHSLEFYDAESSGQLLSRMTADIDVLESLVQSGLGTFVASAGLFVFSLVVLAVMSPLLLGATVICLAPVLAAAARYRRTSTRAYTRVRSEIGDTLAALDEGLAGVRVIQAFRQEDRVSARFSARNESQLRAELATARLASRFFPKVEGFGVVTTALLLGTGTVLVEWHLVSIGTVAAFVLYMGNLFSAVQSLSQLFDLLQSSGAALRTVTALLDTTPAMSDPPVRVPLPERGALELAGVSFSYGASSKAALRDVSLNIGEGEHVALVGPTGAGKSTLAKLAGRLYAPVSGAIRLGGVDLRDAGLEELRRRIVVVPQEGFLFRGTVLENVLLQCPDATEADAERALDALGLSTWRRSLRNGLSTDVGERGVQLSAGERQLVSLARAALSDPAVLVLDEATSNLDPGTERIVERALAALSAGRTTITVAHRLTTASRADRIAVIADGRLVEVGTHEELAAAGGAYAQLFSAWSDGTDRFDQAV